ncbi:MAG: hypothetical protein L6Q37_06170 [Bdellovibrionaceae bacterium]|nr:hypothetical protein [Pseudobdellovibrionaceae bacterium]NUM57879.1 hypothetical protein [Pseudobdellovibrionaceae bacterium]
MNCRIVFALVCCLSLFSRAEEAVIKETKGTLKLLNKENAAVEYNEKDTKDKKFEIQIRPSKSMSKVMMDGKYLLTLIEGKNQFVFDMDQTRGPLKTSETDEKNFRLIYNISSSDNNKEVNKEIKVTCYESVNYKETDTSEKTKKTDCVKKDSCKSYGVKDSKSLELKETPICIGKANTTYTQGNKELYLNCAFFDEEKKNTLILSQLLNTQNKIDIIKKTEKCE